jgi:hypothetical protein
MIRHRYAFPIAAENALNLGYSDTRLTRVFSPSGWMSISAW